MSLIHPTAIIHADAVIGEGTRVGAYSTIDRHVVIGKNCEIYNHATVTGRTRIGDDVKIFPYAAVGLEPQHVGYKGEPTTVQIGDRVTIRESVTINRGTTFGRGITVVEDDVLLMAYCHVAHDCVVGKKVIMANLVNLAGHVVIGDHAVIGGMSAVCQYCRIGDHAFVGGGSLVRKDVPPFLSGKGNDFHMQGVNVVGLTRRGYSIDSIKQLKNLYKLFFLRKLTVGQALEKARFEEVDSTEVRLFLDFIANSKIGIER